MVLTQQLDVIVLSNNAEWQNEHVSTKVSLKTFAVRIYHQFHFLLCSMEYTVLNVKFSIMQTLISNFGYKWTTFCIYRIELHRTIHKEAICVQTDFQNLTGDACHPNNRFDLSDSTSVTHALKTKFFVPNLFTGDC